MHTEPNHNIPTTRPIEEFEAIDHGIENEQYFQGCGIACTSFTDVATGFGASSDEAIEDAIEQLAMAYWDVDNLRERILSDEPNYKNVRVHSRHGDDAYYYVSIRVK